MKYRNSSRFKIQKTDSDTPESPIQEQIEYQRFEKLSQRVTIISILIPFLFGILAIIGYRDIKDRVSQTQDVSARELARITQNLETSISDLSVKQSMLGESLGSKVAKIDSIETTVRENISKHEASVKTSVQKIETMVQDVSKRIESEITDIRTAKADKKDIQADVAGVDSRLAETHKEMKTSIEALSTELKAIDKKLSDESSRLTEKINSVTTSVAECQADLNLLSADKADKKSIEVAVKNQEKRLQDQMDQLQHSLEGKIEALQSHIQELGKIRSSLDKDSSHPVTHPLQTGNTVPQRPGTIQEQPLPE